MCSKHRSRSFRVCFCACSRYSQTASRPSLYGRDWAIAAETAPTAQIPLESRSTSSSRSSSALCRSNIKYLLAFSRPVWHNQIYQTSGCGVLECWCCLQGGPALYFSWVSLSYKELTISSNSSIFVLPESLWHSSNFFTVWRVTRNAIWASFRLSPAMGRPVRGDMRHHLTFAYS